MGTTAKRLVHSVAIGADGVALAEGEAPLELPEAWTPEHLLLVGLVRCTLKSLAFHVRGATLTTEASARSVITRREHDGLYAAVEIAVDVDVELDPEPDDVPGLLRRAELGCFVGNSLTVRAGYRWRVNGRDVAPAG